MRIRKRWPTPLSPPPPPPLDPSPSSPSTHPLHHHHVHVHGHGDEAAKPLHPPCDPPNHSHTQPNQEIKPPKSDLQLIIVKGTNGWICSKGETDGDCMHSTQLKDSQSQLEDEEVIDLMKNKNTSERRPCNGISVSMSSPSHQAHQGEKWCNGELMEQSPIKKKRKKVEKKTSAMLEGSRCSRVNGRGWRCCQQTLAGYSLCEHHLGKGRLRSNTSNTRKNEKQATTTLPLPLPLPCSSSSSSLVLNENPSTITTTKQKPKPKQKQKKIGMVKARSISSLLVQTQQYAPPSPLPLPLPLPMPTI